MGIDIGCIKKSTGMSYSGWGNIRRQLISITFMFLEKMKPGEEECHYFINLKQICKIMMNIIYDEKENLRDNTNDFNVFYQIQRETRLYTNFMQNMKQTPFYLDALIFYGVGGLYSLCDKSDCEGCYSPGNSLDICKWLDLIKDDVKGYEEALYNCIFVPDHYGDCIYDVFDESWKNNAPVIIC